MGKYLLSFFLILVFFDSINSISFPPLFRKFNVEIVNQLQFNKQLKVYCRNKIEKFPIVYLDIGESILLKFKIVPINKYWCNLWQGPNYKHHVVFDAFIPNKHFIENTCNGMHPNICRWTAKELGVYVRNKQGEHVMYKWDVPHKQEKNTSVSAPTSEYEFDS